MRKPITTLAAAIAAAAISGTVLAQTDSRVVYVEPGTGWVSIQPPYVIEQVYVYEPYVYERRHVPAERVPAERRYVPAPRSYTYYDPGITPRSVYMEDAGRRWDAMVGNSRTLTPYEADMIYGRPNSAVYPYASPYYSWPAGNLTASRDSNPSDYATGIYNPKP